ncbi:Drug/metabolite transporter [Artemisia annua]|uniref:Drug/metabolite transporter n=1 Tax=Artemisia annua TaxID=35608 RepID=A0A2U1KL08_ARTAN|nr:Drug/metabolite transporter [Artemisia annua]
MLSLSHNSFTSHSLFRSKPSFSGHPYILSHRRLSYSTFPENHQVLRRVVKCDKQVQICEVSVKDDELVVVVKTSNIPVLKEVEAVVDPAAFTVVRFAVASVPFLPYVWRARGEIQTFNSGIELGLWASLGYLMQALALLTSDAGRASFISMFTVGDLLSFLSALFFGIHMLRTERISRKTEKQAFMSVLGFQVSVVALSSLIWYFIGGAINGSLEVHPSSWTWAMLSNWIVEFPWIPALYTGVFTTGLCLWVEITAMRDVPATEAAIIYGLEPVWGACFAWFLLGERWGISGWFGAVLVLGGSLTVQIFGVSSPSSSGKHDDSSNKEDIRLLSDRQNGLSATRVPVSSRKDVSDLLK